MRAMSTEESDNPDRAPTDKQHLLYPVRFFVMDNIL